MNSFRKAPALGLALTMCAWWSATGSAQEGKMTLERFHDPSYTAGELLEVELIITSGEEAPLSAIGLYETPPEGWELVDWEAPEDGQPAVAPQPGASGVFQFAWITLPALPLRMRYTLAIPNETAGEYYFSGQVEYRVDTGGRLYSPPAVTSVTDGENRAPVITLTGPARFSIALGTAYEEPGYTAADPEDGDISSSVRVEGDVDSNTAGDYTLTYRVADSAGREGNPATRTVTVLAENSGGGTGTGDNGAPGEMADDGAFPSNPFSGNGPGAAAPARAPGTAPLNVPADRFGRPLEPGTIRRSSEAAPKNADATAVDKPSGAGAGPDQTLTGEKQRRGAAATGAAQQNGRTGTAATPPGVKLFFGGAILASCILIAGWILVHRR